jgi:hypothetical protein
VDFKPRRRHIAATDEQKCSKQFTVATTHIPTVDAFIAPPASVHKKGQHAGASWNENGRSGYHLKPAWNHSTDA